MPRKKVVVPTPAPKSVYSRSLDWLIDNKMTVLLLIAIIFGLASFRGCMVAKSDNDRLTEAIKDRDAQIKYWKDENGKEHARANQVEASIAELQILYPKLIDSITQELKITKKQITQYIAVSSTTSGKFKGKVDTVWKHDIDTIPGAPGEDRVDYVGVTYNDKWIDFKAKIKEGGFDAEYTVRDSLNIVGYWKRKGFLGLGKKDYFLDISSNNPNSHIDNVKNFKVTSASERKVGLGVIGGYGIPFDSKVRLRPFVGVGVFYRLY